MYDFHKTRTKDQHKEFKHEYLRKGKPEYLKYIKRKLGDETGAPVCKTDCLLAKFKELEEKCKTFESLAKLSIPIKKLKLVSSEDSSLLFQGLVTFLEEKTSQKVDEEKNEMDAATEDYLEELRKMRFNRLCKSIEKKHSSQKTMGGEMETVTGKLLASKSSTVTDIDITLSKRSENADTHIYNRVDERLNDIFAADDDHFASRSIHSEEFSTDLLDFDSIINGCNRKKEGEDNSSSKNDKNGKDKGYGTCSYF